MSNSKPFDIVNFLFKPVWESEYKQTYRPTGRDLKEAKEFYQLNPTIFDEVIEFQEHAQEYLKSTFEGWVVQHHPCCGLLKNYNAFAPKLIKKQPTRKSQTDIMIHCIDCGQDHPATAICVTPQLREERQ